MLRSQSVIRDSRIRFASFLRVSEIIPVAEWRESNMRQANHTNNIARRFEQSVYGQATPECLAALDRTAEQMLMPRSWVVSQILQQWHEQRQVERPVAEQSWDDGYAEAVESTRRTCREARALLESV